MKIKLLFCCWVFLCAGFKTTQSVSYVVDTKSSTVKWTGHAQTGVYSPSGAIRVKSGSFELAGDGSVTAGKVVIDMTSIQQDNQEMEKHLKDADFFDVVKYPEAEFTLTGMKGNIATGKLTIKGITQPLSFPVTIFHQANRIELKANMKIDRTLYGIKYNSASYFQDLGSYAIRNEFELGIDLYGLKQ